jgi:ribosome biogenesis GTPase A
MLWPRIVVPESGFNLAASGAVGRNAYDDQEVALELLAKLKADYTALLLARYAVPLAPDQVASAPDEALLEAIGRARGALAARGQINAQKTAELVIADFRSNAIGRITLETPEQFSQWLQAGLAADQARTERKQGLRERGHIRAEKPAPKRKPR